MWVKLSNKVTVLSHLPVQWEHSTNGLNKAHVACWAVFWTGERIKSPKGFFFTSGVGIKQWLSPLLAPVPRSSCRSEARHQRCDHSGGLQLSTFLSLIHQNWLIGTYHKRNEEKINRSSHHQWFYNYTLITAKHILMSTQHAGDTRRYEKPLTIDIWPGVQLIGGYLWLWARWGALEMMSIVCSE